MLLIIKVLIVPIFVVFIVNFKCSKVLPVAEPATSRLALPRIGEMTAGGCTGKSG